MNHPLLSVHRPSWIRAATHGDDVPGGVMTYKRWTLVASGLAVAMLVPSAPVQAQGARHWRLTPPGSSALAAGAQAGLAADLAMTADGGLTLSVQRGTTTVVETS